MTELEVGVIRRAQALRLLCKGQGLTTTAIANLPEMSDIFGTGDPIVVRESVVTAIKECGDAPGVEALANALALTADDELADLLHERDRANLMARRRDYLDRVLPSIQMRTLMSYEEHASMLVARVYKPVREDTARADYRQFVERVKQFRLWSVADGPRPGVQHESVLAAVVDQLAADCRTDLYLGVTVHEALLSGDRDAFQIVLQGWLTGLLSDGVRTELEP